MTDGKQNGLWPLPEFYFKVSIEDVGELSFKEVSGLDMEFDVIEYRAGNSNEFTKIKMPGLRKHGDVTMKRGTFISDRNFWTWIGEIKHNTIRRRSVTISLLDEGGCPAQTWKLSNAWPKKITVDEFKSDGNPVAIETLILVHEGIEMV